MAVPTFTSVTPAVGYPGGGETATIVGTNFRTRTIDGSIPSLAGPTVLVTIAGRQAELVEAVSATELRVRIPQYLGSAPAVGDDRLYPAVNIVVTNLDDDGAPIAGESVTATSAFQYEVPPLRAPAIDPSERPLLKAVRATLQLLARLVGHKMERVGIQRHTDYGTSGDSAAVIVEHPSIGLKLAFPKDPDHSYFDNLFVYVDNGDGSANQYDPTYTVMMVVDVTLSTESDSESITMNEAFLDLFNTSPWLTVSAETLLPNATENHYPIELLQEPRQISSPNNANIHAYYAQFRIRGIPIMHAKPRGVVYEINSFGLYSSDLDVSFDALDTF